jgi:hypothetical protein
LLEKPPVDMPVRTTGARSGNSAIKDNLLPIASIDRRIDEMCMSVRFSISEICFCPRQAALPL